MERLWLELPACVAMTGILIRSSALLSSTFRFVFSWWCISWNARLLIYQFSTKDDITLCELWQTKNKKKKTCQTKTKNTLRQNTLQTNRLGVVIWGWKISNLKVNFPSRSTLSHLGSTNSTVRGKKKRTTFAWERKRENVIARLPSNRLVRIFPSISFQVNTVFTEKERTLTNRNGLTILF